jgi:hypothetical protein
MTLGLTLGALEWKCPSTVQQMVHFLPQKKAPKSLPNAISDVLFRTEIPAQTYRSNLSVVRLLNRKVK